MQFVVDIVPDFPQDWSKEKLAEMLSLETQAAMDLMDRGVLLRIDRVVGRGGNISIWEADSPEHLDAALQSLPMAPYIRIRVTPIMKHRVQIAYEARAASRSR
jgi:muconolactone D-isomerase